MNPGVPREKRNHLSQITGSLNCMKLSGINIPSYIGTYLTGTRRCKSNNYIQLQPQRPPSEYVFMCHNDKMKRNFNFLKI